MTTIIGVDHSMCSTGLAVWRDGRFIAVRTLRTAAPVDDPHGWADAQRHRSLLGRILPYIQPEDTVAGIEGRLRIKGDNRGVSDLDMAGLRAVLVYAFAARRVPVASVHPSRLKAYAVRGGASKGEVLEAARQRLGELTGPIQDDDQADAAWIAAMLVHRYVRPAVLVTARQSAVLAREAWPLFTPFPRREVPQSL